MQTTHKFFTAMLVLLAISGGEKSAAQQTKLAADSENLQIQKVTRWYPGEFILQGSRVYQKNCETCHGVNAVGSTQDWRKRKPNGHFPPPPLNGTAHAWHHPLTVLLQTITMGSINQGGEMPSFKDSLTIDEKLSVIAYFQQFWPDEIYASWAQNFPDQFKQSQ
jgi:mono/diheme cytochrome c family protein